MSCKLLIQWKLTFRHGEYDVDILLRGFFIDLGNGGVVQLIVVSVIAVFHVTLHIVPRQYTGNLKTMIKAVRLLYIEI